MKDNESRTTGSAMKIRKRQYYLIDLGTSFSLSAGLDIRKNSSKLPFNSRRDGQAQPESKRDAAVVVISHISAENSLLSPAGFEVAVNASHKPSLNEDAVFVSPRKDKECQDRRFLALGRYAKNTRRQVGKVV
ncbi:MAG: hypothetical protein ACYTEL_13880 [Planctomycetota bacterium]